MYSCTQVKNAGRDLLWPTLGAWYCSVTMLNWGITKLYDLSSVRKRLLLLRKMFQHTSCIMAATWRHCCHFKHSGVIFWKSIQNPTEVVICSYIKKWKHILQLHISFQKYYHFHTKLNSQNGSSFQNFTCSPNLSLFQIYLFIYLKYLM